MREAMYWNPGAGGRVRCELCPHRCSIAVNAAGLCGVRENREGTLFAAGYGQVSSVALDPIEKKPLYMFHPGKRVLSIGGYGCNLKCPFCQNYEISLEYEKDAERRTRNTGSGSARGGTQSISGKAYKEGGEEEEASLRNLIMPEDILSLAIDTVRNGNIGIAYTYNEPLTGYEFLFNCAKLIRNAGLNNVIVTNGYINEEPLDALLPLVDAMNIDLKGFTEGFYKMVGGSLTPVMETITAAHKRCHIEVTTLVIPGANEDDIEELAKWLASIDRGIPLHLSRFFPRYRYSGSDPTPRETIFKLCDLAGKHLRHVFAGNIH